MINPPIKVEIRFHGPAAEHNLLCWSCEMHPAVYYMNENLFKVCWNCQYAMGAGEYHWIDHLAEWLFGVRKDKKLQHGSA